MWHTFLSEGHMGSLNLFKRKAFIIASLSIATLTFPLMAQVDGVMWGMTAAWEDHQYTHIRTQYNMQSNWTDLRKIYFTRTTTGRPTAMNVSASYIKTAGEDSLVSSFFYSNNNLDSMTIAVWDTITKSLKPSNSVAFTYAGTLPVSAKFQGVIAMGMSGTFSISFSYDNQNRIVYDSNIISVGTVFSQTTVSKTVFSSKGFVTTSYSVENGQNTIDGKDSTIYNASGKDSISYSFKVNNANAFELEDVIKTFYNATGAIALVETYTGLSSDPRMRTLYGYGAMPDPIARVNRIFQKFLSKQSKVHCVVNVNETSPIPGSAYNVIGRSIATNGQSKADGVVIVKQSNKVISK
jgi:hypothetical protein